MIKKKNVKSSFVDVNAIVENLKPLSLPSLDFGNGRHFISNWWDKKKSTYNFDDVGMASPKVSTESCNFADWFDVTDESFMDWKSPERFMLVTEIFVADPKTSTTA